MSEMRAFEIYFDEAKIVPVPEPTAGLLQLAAMLTVVGCASTASSTSRLDLPMRMNQVDPMKRRKSVRRPSGRSEADRLVIRQGASSRPLSFQLRTRVAVLIGDKRPIPCRTRDSTRRNGPPSTA